MQVKNGGHCQPLFYGQSIDVVEYELRNFQHISAVIKENHIDCEWKQMKGGCHAYYSQQYFEEVKEEAKSLKEEAPHLGHHVEIVEDRRELAKLKVSNASGAILQSTGARLSPYKLISWILEDLIQKSALNLQTTTPVTSLSRLGANTWAIHTPRGIVETSQVLLATNGYTSHLLPQFEQLIIPVRGEMSALIAPQQIVETPLEYTYSFIGAVNADRSQDDYLVQRPASSGSYLMFGGGRQLAQNRGVNVDSDETIDEPSAKYLRTVLQECLDIDGKPGRTPGAQRTNGNVKEGKELKPKRDWTGIMGYSWDERPWVGGVPGMEGVWLCAGYTGHGMPNAALSSQHVTDLLMSSKQGKDWHTTEAENVQAKAIPQSYLITKERLAKAREIPSVKAPEQKEEVPAGL
ncbi:MAG: hypothetical protein M1827_001777 [Pycnora praestabilis]|nr:MAG: hypothetical protein M1827_001777 [Pycnora praestabilis]